MAVRTGICFETDLAPCRFQELSLTEQSSTFLKDSVLLIPGLLTRPECQLLVAAAEACPELSCGHDLDPRQRLHIRCLGAEAEELSSKLLRHRLLPFLEKELPHVAQELFWQSSGLQDMSFSFARNEPAVNRYTEGGEFPIHRDRKSFTINILLSDPDAFVGGGTAFFPDFPQSRADAASDEQFGYPAREPTSHAKLHLHPCQGTGVIFNGDVQHAGQPVKTGIRHVYVASFNLDTPVSRGGVWAWAPGPNGTNLWGAVGNANASARQSSQRESGDLSCLEEL